MHMKKLIILIFTLYGFTLFAQEKDIKKPEKIKKKLRNQEENYENKEEVVII